MDEDALLQQALAMVRCHPVRFPDSCGADLHCGRKQLFMHVPLRAVTHPLCSVPAMNPSRASSKRACEGFLQASVNNFCCTPESHWVGLYIPRSHTEWIDMRNGKTFEGGKRGCRSRWMWTSQPRQGACQRRRPKHQRHPPCPPPRPLPHRRRRRLPSRPRPRRSPRVIRMKSRLLTCWRCACCSPWSTDLGHSRHDQLRATLMLVSCPNEDHYLACFALSRLCHPDYNILNVMPFLLVCKPVQSTPGLHTKPQQ